MSAKTIKVSEDAHKEASDFCFEKGIILYKFANQALKEAVKKAKKEK